MLNSDTLYWYASMAARAWLRFRKKSDIVQRLAALTSRADAIKHATWKVLDMQKFGAWERI